MVENKANLNENELLSNLFSGWMNSHRDKKKKSFMLCSESTVFIIANFHAIFEKSEKNFHEADKEVLNRF